MACLARRPLKDELRVNCPFRAPMASVLGYRNVSSSELKSGLRNGNIKLFRCKEVAVF